MIVDAAVLHAPGTDYKIEQIELDPPREREVLVELTASGLCHTDDHFVTGDYPLPGPMVAGHEGAGVVVEVGSQVTRVAVGDHVILNPIPNCGQCRWCVTGRANLCDLSMYGLTGYGPDGTYRRHLGDSDIGAFCQLGTFSPYTVVSETQTVAIDRDVPLATAALIGCGITTGALSALKVGAVKAGDVVVVIGTGGVGCSAVQGARIGGAGTIVAVEPGEFRRAKAAEYGATHTVSSIAEAKELVTDLTRGVNADLVIITVGVLHGDLLGEALALTSKGGRCVVTSSAPMSETTANIPLFELIMWNKQIIGHCFGEANPHDDFRRLVALYKTGALKLDDMITSFYDLDQVNEGFAAMHAGTDVRGAIRYK